MINKNIIEAFKVVATEKGIDKTNLSTIIEDLFVNLIRKRSNLTSDDECDDHDELLNSIRQERLVELGFEGDRFHEVKRQQGTFESELGTFEWNDPKLVYPIPQQEIDQHQNMIQNFGY